MLNIRLCIMYGDYYEQNYWRRITLPCFAASWRDHPFSAGRQPRLRTAGDRDGD